MERSIWLGFDQRPAETQAFAVARHSIRARLRQLRQIVPINGVALSYLREQNLYTRPLYKNGNKMFDGISDAQISTEFSISRFLVPHMAGSGLALFADGDVMARADLHDLFDCFEDKSKACMVVKHDYTPKAKVKMEGAAQTAYARKNWSSVVLWNCDHPNVKGLTPEVVNRAAGLWLHQFAWLHDDDIGELDPCWNHLVGELPRNPSAKLVHFTQGTPNMHGHEQCEYATEWWKELEAWQGVPAKAA